jgi:putative transposase
MGHTPRIVFPGAIYHVSTRSHSGLAVLGEDALREAFLDELTKVVARREWICDAYCLMTNHYHLLLRTPAGGLSEGLQQLNANVARSYNRWVPRRGPVWEGRFDARLIESDAHLLQAARYVVLNPVRAGLCTTPDEWRWSSYRATADLERRPRFLTTSWLAARLHGAAGYRRFVAEGSPSATLRGLLLAA